MKLTVWEIPEEGLEVTMEKDSGWMKSYHEEWPSIYTFHSGIKGKLKLTRLGNKVKVEGSFETELELECSKCMDKFLLPLRKNFISEFYPLEDFVWRSSEPVELRKHEMEMEFYTKGIIDIEEILSTNIILNIPMYPVCSETCKGICPNCGRNLNREKCTCSGGERIRDERWSPLAGLKDKLLKR